MEAVRHFMRMRVESVLELTHLLDYTMPGIQNAAESWNETNGKDKLGDFAEEYWHMTISRRNRRNSFIESYLNGQKKKGYHRAR